MSNLVRFYVQTLKISIRNFILLTAIIASTVLSGTYCVADELPYLQSSSAIQITLKNHSSSVHQTSYLITSGDIEGDADLTPAPSTAEGQLIVSSQLVGVKSTFENSNAPYGGQITALITCNMQKYVKEQPVTFEGSVSQAILAVATARRGFGACSFDLVKYASVFWAGYDMQRKQVLTIKLFKPVMNPNKIDDSQKEILQILKKIINKSGGL